MFVVDRDAARRRPRAEGRGQRGVLVVSAKSHTGRLISGRTGLVVLCLHFPHVRLAMDIRCGDRVFGCSRVRLLGRGRAIGGIGFRISRAADDNSLAGE